MNKPLLVIWILFASIFHISAQKSELIVVKAGTRLIDYFPVSERYLYSEFTTGRIFLKNGTYSEKKLNYNYMAGEMEFLQGRDTLSIANTKDIRLILVTQDTFYFDRGYIEQLRGGKIIVGRKQYVELKEKQNVDSYGSSGSGGSVTAVGNMAVEGNFYKLIANKDLIFKRTLQYYYATSGGRFIQCTKKNILKMFPGNDDKIKAYLKAGNVSFESREDILKLADFLLTL
jgi:hypothetical protein